MITIEQCKKLLGKYGKEFTNDNIRAVRDFLYKMAQIEVESYNIK